MSDQELIKQAIASFSKNDQQHGKLLLQQAADAGSSVAVLYYADVIFKENRQQAYDYLESYWQKGIKGTLHRRALLRCFFNDGTDESDIALIFSDLHSEAIDGDMQSIIALISVMAKSSMCFYYIGLLRQLSPELCAQLLPDTLKVKNNATTPVYDDLMAEFINEFQAQKSFDKVVVASDIDLVLAKSVVNDFECRYMMLRFGALLQPSLIVDPHSGKEKQHPYRTSSMVAIVPEYLDWIGLSIEQRISLFSGFERKQGEVMNLLHYTKQQRYLPHFDAIFGQDKNIDKQLRNGGQRQATVLCYLNTVASGGETAFPRLRIKVPAVAGDMLMFCNVDRRGEVLQKSYHSGELIVEGEKWVLSKWIRQGVTDYGNFTYC